MEKTANESLAYIIFKPVFAPFDAWLAPIPPIFWTLSALGLFLAAMIWVFTLRKEYIFLDASKVDIWHDLRIWTVISMLPHIFVYFWFSQW